MNTFLGVAFLILGLILIATPVWPLGCAMFILGGYFAGGSSSDDWDYEDDE